MCKYTMYLDIIAIQKQQNNLPGLVGRNKLFVLNIGICSMVALVYGLSSCFAAAIDKPA
jgi:hypothetical protein